jgi:hypothetical protein
MWTRDLQEKWIERIFRGPEALLDQGSLFGQHWNNGILKEPLANVGSEGSRVIKILILLVFNGDFKLSLVNSRLKSFKL